jgi:hypothetical protein
LGNCQNEKIPKEDPEERIRGVAAYVLGQIGDTTEDERVDDGSDPATARNRLTRHGRRA